MGLDFIIKFLFTPVFLYIVFKRLNIFNCFHRTSSTPSATTADLSRELSSSGRTASRRWLNILFLGLKAVLYCCRMDHNSVFRFVLLWIFVSSSSVAS